MNEDFNPEYETDFGTGDVAEEVFIEEISEFELLDEEENLSESDEEMPDEEDFFTEDSVAEPIEYTPVEPVNEHKRMNKGLAVFAVIISLVIMLTGCCLAAYYAGRRGATILSGDKVQVDLAHRPTKKDAMTPSEVYEETEQSIVGIRTYNVNGEVSDASGVIYSEDGYIVTNDHIYKGIPSAKFKVYLCDGTEYNASYVAGDTVSDLAVLKIEGAKDLKPAVFGNSDEVVCGEDVVAIGRSDASSSSVISWGIISMTSRRVSSSTNYSVRLIQTDSAINPGNSGGALINLYGQVVGITCSKLEGTEYDRVGFAIPTTTMKRVVEQLIRDGKVTDRAKLGITYNEINSISAEINNLQNTGLLIASVSEDSDLYGKVKKGDMITHINGVTVTTADVVLDTLENSKAGDTVMLTVLFEDGSSLDFDVKLGANVGQSSYSQLKLDETKPQENNEDFNFPAGE